MRHGKGRGLRANGKTTLIFASARCLALSVVSIGVFFLSFCQKHRWRFLVYPISYQGHPLPLQGLRSRRAECRSREVERLAGLQHLDPIRAHGLLGAEGSGMGSNPRDTNGVRPRGQTPRGTPRKTPQVITSQTHRQQAQRFAELPENSRPFFPRVATHPEKDRPVRREELRGPRALPRPGDLNGQAPTDRAAGQDESQASRIATKNRSKRVVSIFEGVWVFAFSFGVSQCVYVLLTERHKAKRSPFGGL